MGLKSEKIQEPKKDLIESGKIKTEEKKKDSSPSVKVPYDDSQNPPSYGVGDKII